MTGAAGRGVFVTFEGPDGSGKSTQLERLADVLRAEGRSVIAAREPGGTPLGENVRALLLSTGGDGMRPITEALLFCAARSELVQAVLRPALAAGSVVVCDRFADATLAYQGYGRGVDLATLTALNAVATNGLEPDLTVLLDLPVEAGLARRPASEWNRLDAAGQEFHRRVRHGYLALARADARRWVMIPADHDPEWVAAQVLVAVRRVLVAAESAGGGSSRPNQP